MSLSIMRPALSVLLLSWICTACHPPAMPNGRSMEHTMGLADVVIHGKVLGVTEHDPSAVAVEVYCVYKFGDTVPANYTGNFTISGRYRYHSCRTTVMDFGKEYVIALKKNKEYGYYYVNEPNVSTSGAYEVKTKSKRRERLLRKVASVCGMINGHETLHADDMGITCKGRPTGKRCVSKKW